MRVAVCLTGEMRNKPECLRSLVENVIHPFEAVGAWVELFIHARMDNWYQSAFTLPNIRAVQVEVNRTRDSSMIVSEHNPEHMGEREGDDRRAYLYQSYLQQYWSLQGVGQMKIRAEKQDGAVYDWVVRSRPDVYIKQPLPVKELKGGCINFPWNDWWPHPVAKIHNIDTVTDKFAVGPSAMMDVYFDKIGRRGLGSLTLERMQDLNKTCPVNWLQWFCQKYNLRGEAFTAWQLYTAGIPYVRHEGIEVQQAENPYEHSRRPDR